MKCRFALIACLVLGCNNPKEQKTSKSADSPEVSLPNVVREEPVKNTDKFDSLVQYYVENTADSAIILAKNEGISWMYDRVEETDSGKFVVVHLGRSFDSHFATDGWLYIDSVHGTIFQYHVANDSLMKWSGH